MDRDRLRVGGVVTHPIDKRRLQVVRHDRLDLVETDSLTIQNDPSYRATFVYGNVLVEPDAAGNRQIAHYGGDNGTSDDFVINAGSHRLLAFTLSGGQWQLNSSSVSFTDDNRNGVGIPEPTTLGLLGVGAAGLLIRRRRHA